MILRIPSLIVFVVAAAGAPAALADEIPFGGDAKPLPAQPAHAAKPSVLEGALDDDTPAPKMDNPFASTQAPSGDDAPGTADALGAAQAKASAKANAEAGTEAARAILSGGAANDANPAAPPPPPDLSLPPPSSGIGDLVGQLIKMVLMLGVVVALAYLTLSKGLGKLVERQNVGKRVKVVERVALDAKRSLFLVDLDGKQMLFGGGENGSVNFIKDVESSASTQGAKDAPPSVGARFTDALKRKVAGDPPVTSGLAKKTPDEKASA